MWREASSSKPSCPRTRTEQLNVTLGGLEPRPLDPETNERAIGPIIRDVLELGQWIKETKQYKNKNKNKKRKWQVHEGQNVFLNIDQNTSVGREIEVFRDLKFQVPYRAIISEKKNVAYLI